MEKIISQFVDKNRPLVCVQGLGFVGSAMSVAAAMAKDENGVPYFNVVGVDLPTKLGKSSIDQINKGVFPFGTIDKKLLDSLATVHKQGNLIATSDESVYSLASVVVIDVNFDVDYIHGIPTVDFGNLRKIIRILGQRLKPGSLIIIETTVPPGTCEKVVAPELNECLLMRGLPDNSISLAHSYERVMPGEKYYDSIVNYWRVYAGFTETAANMCEEFLSKIINVKKYPLTRLPLTTASETAKVLENSYRTVNIAFIEEWSRFAEDVGIDLYQIIDAIRVRPTHCNIRQPGFGVGGYCLTKDPMFASISATTLFNLDNKDFPFCTLSLETNRNMPLASLEKIEEMLGGSLMGKRILLLGVSYRPGVADTRYSPAETFVVSAEKKGAVVHCHDPLIQYWPELDVQLPKNIPPANKYDGIVFAVSHVDYQQLDLIRWLGSASPCILDANNVLTESQRRVLKNSTINFRSTGRGEVK